MIKDYHFKDIKKYLTSTTDVGRDILEAFDKLSDAAIIFSPIIFGPQYLSLLELLTVKSKLVDLGQNIYNFITKEVELDYIKRTEQIQAAYALICYTAYFDTLEAAIPANINNKLKLELKKQKELVGETIKSPSAPDVHCSIFYADHVTSFGEIKEKLIDIYKRVTDGLIKMISDSSVFNHEKEKDQQEFEQLKQKLIKLPKKALKKYEAQYLKLADQFQDFALFAQLQNFTGLYHTLKHNHKAIELLSNNISAKIDIGFNKLNDVVNSIFLNYSTIQAQKIVDDLKLKYISMIEEPIIDAKEINPDTENISLCFPKIIDAFIPQSYKCLPYKHKGTKLENLPIWDELPVKNDLNNFFIKYLYSPDSIDYPLIILGHPGSGKSLLTKVLSAQLMSNSYTVIRIPLREVNANDEIDILVEDQIKKLTNRSLSIQGYGEFAEQFKEKPLIIILDGYDELLQAKGDIFSNYLEKARKFQQDQKSMKRPVRIIITSRITLIDKARIPENSTILRLMEFDKQQRQAWIDIWNKVNAEYFQNSNIEPFTLPINSEGKKNNVLELAEQPLLLLMLALYDAESNDLAQTSSIGRTELYDSLIRKFVRRERIRYVPGFSDKTLIEQEKIIEQEMNRLGVIAIGMYNRRDVAIRSEQLEKDLGLFQARRNDGSQEADSAFRGFFFIHKSIAQDIVANGNNSENAYEFLHNTFGEFLAADFILRNTINEVKNVYVDRMYKSSDPTTKLTNPDRYNSAWFYCLMLVPLYSRSVIVEMLREHAMKAFQHSLQINDPLINLSEADFIENLKLIVQNQLKMILNTRNTPKIMHNGVLFDNDMPLLGYFSTYSLNLIILACTISNDGFEFDENEYRKFNVSELDLKPWDKIASLWKTWFSSADLAGLSAILKAKRVDDTTVLVVCNEKFEAMRYEQSVDITLCISHTLVDNLLVGLSGLQTDRFSEITRMSETDICQMLNAESPDLYFSYLITLLRKKINVFSIAGDEVSFFGDRFLTDTTYFEVCESINNIISRIISDERIYFINSNTLLNIFEILECCQLRGVLFLSLRKKLAHFLSHLLEKTIITKKKNKSPEIISGIRLLQLLINDTDCLIFNFHPSRNLPTSYMIWSNSYLDYVISNMSDYSINSHRLILNYKVNNMYDSILLDVIEASTVMKTKDKVRILKKIISLGNLNIMLETNPELLSQGILSLLKGENINRVIDLREMICIFLSECFQQMASIGIEYFGFNATLNILSLVCKMESEPLQIKFTNLIQDEIFKKSPEFLSMIIYFRPSFVADLIKIMPNIFNNTYLKAYGQFVIGKRIQNIETKNLLNYIKLCRCINELNNKKAAMLLDILNRLNMIVNYIFRSNDFKKINFDSVTIDQFNDLIWYSNSTNDISISKKIREITQHYLSLK